MTDIQDLSPIFEALDLESMTAEEQAEVLADIQELLAESTLARLIEQMTEDAAQTFGELLESEASEEQIEAFIAQHVPDAARAAQEALEDLTNDILTNTDN